MRTITVSDGRPLSAHLYELIRDDIIDGVLAPNTQLIQEQLAERYNVSRTPVRESLNQLVHDGLAVPVPGSGYIVSDLTAADISDVYEVRRGLEAIAIRRFGCRYSPVDLAKLEMLILEGEQIQEGELDKLFLAGREFHTALVAPCDNPYLLHTLDAVWDHPVQRRITRAYKGEAERVRTVTSTHRRVLAAARAGDADDLIDLLHSCHRVDD